MLVEGVLDEDDPRSKLSHRDTCGSTSPSLADAQAAQRRLQRKKLQSKRCMRGLEPGKDFPDRCGRARHFQIYVWKQSLGPHPLSGVMKVSSGSALESRKAASTLRLLFCHLDGPDTPHSINVAAA
jgi:hypothetical protein